MGRIGVLRKRASIPDSFSPRKLRIILIIMKKTNITVYPGTTWSSILTFVPLSPLSWIS